MEFLVDARLPFLDSFISGPTQSILCEVLFWTVAYLAFSSIFSHVFRNLYRKTPLWDRAKKRIGIFCGNGRDDAVLLSLFCLHHGTAGYLMYLGIQQGDSTLFRHGYLLETGFEVADLFAMALPLYPYKLDGMKPDIIGAMIFHHLPGIVMAPFVMDTGLYENVHFQMIALFLLLGAAVSCIGGLYIYTLNFDTHMKRAALVYCINIGFFVYCRWYIFPTESVALLQDVNESEQFKESIVSKLLLGVGIVFSLFNLAIAIDVVPKTVRYVMRAMDGVTRIETEPIPSSRDSVVMKKQSRRSSLLNGVSSITATNKRRSSFLTVMNMNTIEDVATAGVVQEETTLEGISEDDAAALKQSVGTLQGKKQK